MAADVYLYLYKGDAAVKGGCTDAVFTNAIQLKTFSMNAEGTIESDSDDNELETQADQLKLPGAGKITDAEKPLDSFSIEFTKEFDIASTALFKNYATVATNAKTFFTKAEVYCRIGGPVFVPGMKRDQLCVLVYDFRKLYVYEYSLEVSNESVIPTETCKLYFDAYRITYRPQLKTGKLGTALPLGWDFESNKAL